MTSQQITLEKPVIIITVYDRYHHIKQCLESLESAHGSEKYQVIIGSDAPSKSEHNEKISFLRAYLLEKEKEHRFKRFTVLYHEKNIGANENIELCHLFAKSCNHQSFIFMEDDIIVGNYFLDFITDGLEAFRDDEEVIAIHGYLDQNFNINHSKPFLYNRSNAYGFASWYHKWDKLQQRINSINYAAKVISDTKLFKKLVNFSPNAKSYPFLAENVYEAADIEIGLMMEIEGLWALYPPVSLTANRGMDGSGLRSGIDVALQSMEPHNEKIKIPELLSINRLRLEEIKDSLSLKYIASNWFSFIFYRYVPFGFEILKRLRVVKKSVVYQKVC